MNIFDDILQNKKIKSYISDIKKCADIDSVIVLSEYKGNNLQSMSYEIKT